MDYFRRPRAGRPCHVEAEVIDDCIADYSGETAIFGLGRSGLAAVAALCAAGNRVVAWDDAEAPRAKAAELGADIRDLTQDFGAAERLIVSPGVPLTHPERMG